MRCAIHHSPRGQFRTRAAKAGRLRFAAAFGDGFGERGEDHRGPEPERDLAGKQRVFRADADVANEEDRHVSCDHLNREHDGIAPQRQRIELAEGRQEGRAEDLGIEKRNRCGLV